METRKITVFDSQSANKQEFQSSAATWGEFKSEVNEIVTFADKRVTIRETRTTVESDEAMLPEGDIVLFVFQQKSKFGGKKEMSRQLDHIVIKLDEIINLLNNDESSDINKIVDEELEALKKEAIIIRESML